MIVGLNPFGTVIDIDYEVGKYFSEKGKLSTCPEETFLNLEATYSNYHNLSIRKEIEKEILLSQPNPKLIAGIHKTLGEITKRHTVFIFDRYEIDTLPDYLKRNNLTKYFAAIYHVDVNNIPEEIKYNCNIIVKKNDDLSQLLKILSEDVEEEVQKARSTHSSLVKL